MTPSDLAGERADRASATGQLDLRLIPQGTPLSLDGTLLNWGSWVRVNGQPSVATGADGGITIWNPVTEEVSIWASEPTTAAQPIATPIQSESIPSWPKVTIRLYDDHNAELKIAGRSHPLVTPDPRQAAILIVAERAAQLGRAMRATAIEPDGASWPLVIHPDGMVEAATSDFATRRRPAASTRNETVRWGVWGQLDGGSVLASGGDDGTVRLYNLADDARRRPLRGFDGRSGAMLWGAWGQIDGQPVLATGGIDGVVRLWSPTTGHRRGPVLADHAGPVRWGSWGLIDGEPVLATGGDDGFRLYDPATGVRRSMQSSDASSSTALWGAWGQVDREPVLATGADTGHVRLWDPATGSQRGPALTGHAGPVNWGAWARMEGASILATGGADGTVRLWNPATGSQRGPALTGHTGPVNWGAWGQIEQTPVLATGGADGTIRLWHLVQERAVPRVPRYSSDTAGAADRLGRREDAAALADVITARSARPPLAVGIFGQWGDGKSLFLEMLEEQVAERARAAGPSDTIAHGLVRQVRFNAWHYAEADLWASLVAELFAQLSADTAGGDPVREHRQRSRLASELIDARGLRLQLAAAQARLNDLREASTARRTEWSELPTPARQHLQEVFGDQARTTYEKLLTTDSAAKGSFRSIARLIRGLPSRWLVGTVLAAVVAGTCLLWGPTFLRWLATVPAVIAAGALVNAGRKSWDDAQPLRQQLATARVIVQGVRDEQTRRLQTAEAVASAEVMELQSRLQNLTAAGQLAGLVQEHASAGRYRDRLGLRTEIRHDFERMAELLERAAHLDVPAKDEAGDELPAIDRIVVYIDDLDRCPPGRVVEVLEAVHLLLAARLFVVVVAVDPRWLLRSLTSHYQQLFPAAGTRAAETDGTPSDISHDETWTSTPAQYLEKIFQIVLTLAPMQQAGYQQMIDDLVAVHAVEPTQADLADVAPVVEERQPALRGSTAEAALAEQPLHIDSLRIVERIDPLALTADEHKLLSLLGPPLIAAPRAVKRLANSYGLLVALSSSRYTGDRPELRPVPDLDDEDGHPYRAAMVLLAVVIGFPMLSCTLFPDLHQRSQETPALPWKSYLHGLRPRHGERGWTNSIEPTMPPGRRLHWDRLLDSLESIDERADRAGLQLPRRLDLWARWVVPVGRLSFPTGSAISRLILRADQQAQSA